MHNLWAGCLIPLDSFVLLKVRCGGRLSKDGLGPRLRGDDEICKGLLMRAAG